MNMQEMPSVLRTDILDHLARHPALDEGCQNRGQRADGRAFDQAGPAHEEQSHHQEEDHERQEAGAQQADQLLFQEMIALFRRERRPQMRLQAAADGDVENEQPAISRPGNTPASHSWPTGWRAIMP
jgi:hypothetical protein